MDSEFQKLRLEQLDRQLEQLQSIRQINVPKSGWIKTLRRALGMTTKQLAQRIGVSQPTVIDQEKSEIAESIRLKTLRRAADALGCDLQYFLIPRKPLVKVIQERAESSAESQLEVLSHTMLLEDQEVADVRKEAEHNKLTQKLIEGSWKKLW